MSWMMVGAATVATLSSAKSGTESAQSLSKVNIAQNDAITKTNIANSVRTGYRIGLLNLQQALTKRQAQQHSADTTAQAKQVLGAVNANAAAAGTIGASVDAISSDVQMKLGEAQAQQSESWEINLTNFNTKLADLVQQGKDSISEAVKADIPSNGKILGNALIAGASTFAMSYFASQMKLGMGSTPGGSATPLTGSSIPTGELGTGLSTAGSSFGANVGGTLNNPLSTGFSLSTGAMSPFSLEGQQAGIFNKSILGMQYLR